MTVAVGNFTPSATVRVGAGLAWQSDLEPAGWFGVKAFKSLRQGYSE
jgi:hypothetical protein